MLRQSTSRIIMVRPDYFGFNPQTATTNPFQHTPQSLHKNEQEIRDEALPEFTKMVDILRKYDIEVLVLPSRSDVVTPDAIFPNNWFSHHQDGKLVLYPMLTPNRRLERQKEALLRLIKKIGILKPEIIDLTKDEENGLILESTGSMVLDRVHKVAFAMASARTIEKEFEKWCRIMGYEGIFICTTTQHSKEVYHTNINMCIGSEFAVVCLEVIEEREEREMVRQKLIELDKDVIEITLAQVHQFCGNILELSSKTGKELIVMSETACKAFTKEQLARLEQYGTVVSFAIPTIEEVGGGGVRCMIAEIFPPER